MTTDVADLRANELYEATYNSAVRKLDRLFAGLLVFQWLAGIAAALWLSPYAWDGMDHVIHPHIWTAVLVGGVIAALPVMLAIVLPGRALTRHSIAVAQIFASALLIHLTGGRIETHFHVFGSLAFLSFYRDWRVLVTATVVVAADHMARGYFWPQSAYGVASGAEWRWIEHAGWVLFEDAFLIFACVQGRREMRASSTRQAQLEHADQAKSQFLTHMSHELRTPLNGVIGMTDVLMATPLEEKQRQSALLIKRSGIALTGIIDDILDLAKIEAGKMEIQQERFEPRLILDLTSEVLAPSASTKGLQLKVSADPVVPGIVYGDADRVRQVMVNLIGNAIKFTTRGSVSVSLSATEDHGDQVVLRFGVTDTGPGISSEQMKRLFKAFSQVDASTNRLHGGTGLGLVISKQLAELMGGTVGVESTPGSGSTFWFTVRVQRSAPVRSDPPIATPPSSRTPSWQRHPASAATAPRRRVRVLLAEDNETNQIVAGEILKRCGYEFSLAPDGRAAVEALERGQFDLVLMDCQMPVMDGYEATRKIRNLELQGKLCNGTGRRIPIVAVTAHAMKGDKERCLEAGMDAYTIKPIDPLQLAATIGSLLQETSVDGAR